MRSSIVAVLALAAFTTSAQTPFPTPRLRIPAFHPQLLIDVPTDCPLHLVATQLHAERTAWTIASEDLDLHRATRASSLFPQVFFGVGVHVYVYAESSVFEQMPRSIFRVQLAVDYVAESPTRPPTAMAPFVRSTKTYTLTSGMLPVFHLDGDLLVGPVNTITRVRLLSVDDDQSRAIPVPDHCSVVPAPQPPETAMAVSG